MHAFCSSQRPGFNNSSRILQADYTTQHHDQTADSRMRKEGRPRECTNTMITDSHCSPDRENLTVKCRSIYLPREITIVMIMAVYTPLYANANSTRKLLGERTLDKVYSNIKLGYRAGPLLHLGQSDHLSLLLMPAYAPSGKLPPPSQRLLPQS